MRRLIRRAAVALGILTTTLATARADIHALIVGINDYDGNAALKGAVADADDIFSALRKLGPHSITVLRNREATRAKILAGLDDLARKARPGDIIVFTYAGHGGRENWRAPNGKLEKAESFILSGFNPKARRFDERILDKEMNVWLKRMAATQAKVIFVADSCHAGGMTRSVAPIVGTQTVRSAPYELPTELAVSADLKAADAALTDLPHVTFLAATQEERLTPEVLIDGQMRGALSYAFARALEGAANPDQSGVLTHLGLATYVTSSVRQLSESRQTPEIIFRSGGDNEPVLTGLPRPPPPQSSGKPLRLKLVGAPANAAASLKHVVVVTDTTAALIWDAKTSTVVSSHGDQVAEAITLEKLQGVVDKWRTLEVLKPMIAAKPLKLTLMQGDKTYLTGDAATFKSSPATLPHFTAFNLAADGTIQYLYPEGRDPNTAPAGKPYTLETQASTPYGADHLIVVATEKPVQGFRALLSNKDRPLSIADLPQTLRDALQSGNYAIGLQGLYTQAKQTQAKQHRNTA